MTTPTIIVSLPLSCPICLEKVKSPVICPNGHVFCEKCMNSWLISHNQCPSCRVEISPSNPCKQVLGASDETVQDASLAREIRQARVMSILRYYEDELDTARDAVDAAEMRAAAKAAELEEFALQMKPVLDLAEKAHEPVTVKQPSSPTVEQELARQCEQQARRIRHLEAALTATERKLMEQNRQIGTTQENNLHLRAKAEMLPTLHAEIDRLTSANALLERNSTRLLKALEVNDRYIEGLQRRGLVRTPTRRTPTPVIASSPVAVSILPLQPPPPVNFASVSSTASSNSSDLRSSTTSDLVVPTVLRVVSALEPVAKTAQPPSGAAEELAAPSESAAVVPAVSTPISTVPAAGVVAAPIDVRNFYSNSNTAPTQSTMDQFYRVKKAREPPQSGANALWVNCDLCHKWRKLNSHPKKTQLPEHWFCFMNKDVSRASCDVPEEHWEFTDPPHAGASDRKRKIDLVSLVD